MSAENVRAILHAIMMSRRKYCSGLIDHLSITKHIVTNVLTQPFLANQIYTPFQDLP